MSEKEKKAVEFKVYPVMDSSGKVHNVKCASPAEALADVFGAEIPNPLTGAKVMALYDAGTPPTLAKKYLKKDDGQTELSIAK